jgi:hypothetical protein
VVSSFILSNDTTWTVVFFTTSDKASLRMVCGIRRKNRKYATDVVSGCHAMWFRDKKDEGVLFPEFYKPFPEVGLALLLTAVRVVLFLAARSKQMTLPGILMHCRTCMARFFQQIFKQKNLGGESIVNQR